MYKKSEGDRITLEVEFSNTILNLKHTLSSLVLIAPILNDIVVCEFDILIIISPENYRPVLRKDLFHFESPIHL